MWDEAVTKGRSEARDLFCGHDDDDDDDDDDDEEDDDDDADASLPIVVALPGITLPCQASHRH